MYVCMYVYVCLCMYVRINMHIDMCIYKCNGFNVYIIDIFTYNIYNI